MEKQQKFELVKRIGAGYIIVALFLLIFILFTNKTFDIHDDLSTPQWAGVVALILVLPLILVPIIKYLWPRLTGISIPNILELTLTSETADDFATKFHNIIGEDDIAISSPVMSDNRGKIIKVAKELQRTKKQSVIVNLKKGHEWHVTQLCFLTLLIARQRLVDQIVFVETGLKNNEFVAMCSPDELLRGLVLKFPEYYVVKQKVEEAEAISSTELTDIFFTTLQDERKKSGEKKGQRIWLTSEKLVDLVGEYLHKQHLEYKEKFDEIDYKHIVNSQYMYMAILKDNEYNGIIDQRQCALKIARIVMD